MPRLSSKSMATPRHRHAVLEGLLVVLTDRRQPLRQAMFRDAFGKAQPALLVLPTSIADPFSTAENIAATQAARFAAASCPSESASSRRLSARGSTSAVRNLAAPAESPEPSLLPAHGPERSACGIVDRRGRLVSVCGPIRRIAFLFATSRRSAATTTESVPLPSIRASAIRLLLKCLGLLKCLDKEKCDDRESQRIAKALRAGHRTQRQHVPD